MRTKHTFTSSEIAHVWAHEGAEWGKSPGAMSFRGPEFRSYSTTIGRIIKHKGKRAFVIDREFFSPTTSGHQSHMRQAIPHDAKLFGIKQGTYGQSLDFTPVKLRDYYLAARKAVRVRKGAKHLAPVYEARAIVSRFEYLENALDVCRFFGLATKRLENMFITDALASQMAASIIRTYEENLQAKRVERWNKREERNRESEAQAIADAIAYAEKVISGAEPYDEQIERRMYSWNDSRLDERPDLKAGVAAVRERAMADKVTAWKQGASFGYWSISGSPGNAPSESKKRKRSRDKHGRHIPNG